MKRLVISGVEVDIKDYDGRTPLHLAASEGHLEVIEYLFVSGLRNINPIDRWDNTPLDDAERGNFELVVAFLVSKGAKKAEDLRHRVAVM